MDDDNSLFGRLKRTFGGKAENSEQAAEEIISMISEGHEQGYIEEHDAQLIKNVFLYKEKDARDIMTHRKNIVALDGELTLAEAIPFILEQINSRFPVYLEDIDDIIGVINLRDAMKGYCNASLREVPMKDLDEEYIRPVSFVPETKDIDKLFRQMQEEKNHMVIVLDEYGQTAGLVAMEDILEEIVGNIMDEFDDEEELIVLQEDGTYLANGMTALDDLGEVLQIEFIDDDHDTLNGFFIMLLEHIPSEEEECIIRYEGYEFRVMAVDNNVIQTVRITKEVAEDM